MNVSTRWFWFIGLASLTIFLYSSSFRYAPFFDDANFFEFGGLNTVFHGGGSFSPRWLPYFSMAWIDLLFEERIYSQRIASLVFHLLTTYALYVLVRQVSQHVAPHRNNERAALAAALLFALHPLAVYATGYMIQRTIVMATLFGLLSLSAYFDGCITRKKTYFLFSALFYFLSAFSKEHAVLIPAAALALTPLAVPLNRQSLRMLALPIGLFAAIALLVVYKTRYVIGQTYEPFASMLVDQHLGIVSGQSHWLLSVMTQATLFFRYLGLMLVPNPEWMSIDMRVPFARHVGDVLYLVGSLAFLAYGGLALYLLLQRGVRGLVGYALLAPWLLFLVELSAVRIQEPFVLYRSYLWMPLVFFLVPALTQKLDARFFWAGLIVLSIAFGLAARDRLDSFSGKFSLWNDAVEKLPTPNALGSARTYYNRGNAFLSMNKVGRAIADYTHALQVNPNYLDALSNRALAYQKLADYHSALHDAEEAVRLHPNQASALMIRGRIHKGRKEFSKALADFDSACVMKHMPSCLLAQFTRNELKIASELTVPSATSLPHASKAPLIPKH